MRLVCAGGYTMSKQYWSDECQAKEEEAASMYRKTMSKTYIQNG